MLRATVLTADIRFEGWTTEDWTRFLRLWQPRATPDRERTRARGGIIVVHEDGQTLKLLHTRHGRIDPASALLPAGQTDARALALRTGQPSALGQLARAHNASWAFGMRLGALDEVMERFGERARRGDDLTTQSLMLVGIVRDMIAEGVIATWPQRLRGFPVPTSHVVRRTLDSVCPDGRAMALGLFDGGGLHVAFIARCRDGALDLIAGPEDLRPALGLLSGDWRRDYRHLVRAIEDRYASLGFGCFAELDRFRALQTDSHPGAWTRAVAVRDVLISPMPTAVGVALGVDGVRYALQGLRTLTERIVPFAALGPFVDGARVRIAKATGRDLHGILGFDLLAALRALLKR
jgi:hypothetical protein